MPRYAAFLRGVMPTNAKMPELKKCFEEAGFGEVRTLLSSGNVVFDARKASEAALERRAEAAMMERLGRAFYTIVRPVSRLNEIIEADPFAQFKLGANAKRVITFLREPHHADLSLPIEVDGARILAVDGREIFTAYLPTARGPAFMALIQRTFGENVTTRTWDTVRKCSSA
ncbi:MAG TPA: DUF1697 domain-containing protein [Gemmatimonadaceae bacterium]|jgi:uncharacterized protein (DUF1697 family)|nr:DUF1697 domain-containing protein [Gemmatimonadaceae bacterium]